jgi:hypothetical protein
MSASMREAQARDWLEDLREFGPGIVAEACLRWRRQPGGRRPTPGDIRTFCIEERNSRPAPDQDALPAPDWQKRVAEKNRYAHTMAQQEGRDRIEAWAQSRGYDSVEAYAQARGVHWSDAYRECISEIMAGAPIAQSIMGGSLAGAFGVSAKEYAPTPEQLEESRRELGLEPDQF